MLNISYGTENVALASQIERDLKAARIRAYRAEDGTPKVLIALIAPQSSADEAQAAAWQAALNHGDFLVPVLANGAALPGSLAQYDALDFSGGYDANALLERLAQMAQREQQFPLRVIAPKTKRGNRRTALVLTVLAVFMFGAAIWGISVGLVGFPEEEYEEVEAEFQGTLGALVDNVLPRSTQDAQNFPATVDAAPTRLQPLLAQTATALYAGGE
jgi:hypothetical protein